MAQWGGGQREPCKAMDVWNSVPAQSWGRKLKFLRPESQHHGPSAAWALGFRETQKGMGFTSPLLCQVFSISSQKGTWTSWLRI